MPGIGTSKQQTNTVQNTQTGPWLPAQGALGNVINALTPMTQNYQPNAAEQSALTQIQNNAASIPNFTSQATGLLNSLFSGGTDRTGIVNDAYSQYQKALTPYTQAADPTQAPGMADVLNTIRGDVANSVNGLFAGAGRDLSGAHVNQLARGISSGLAAPLLQQYNTNADRALAASGNLFNAGGSTAGLLSGLDQTALGNQIQGLGVAPAISDANAGANAQLQAEQTARGLPLSNLGQVLNLLLPIAGLGSQGNATGTSTSYNTMSPLAQALGVISGFRTLFPAGK